MCSLKFGNVDVIELNHLQPCNQVLSNNLLLYTCRKELCWAAQIWKTKQRCICNQPWWFRCLWCFCDQTTAGGGWTVFQKRMDGSVDFYRGWAEYKRGFGNLNGGYWLGLDKIQRMTSSGGYKLRVDWEDFAGNIVYAEYASFEVGSERTYYQLTVGSYSGWL